MYFHPQDNEPRRATNLNNLFSNETYIHENACKRCFWSKLLIQICTHTKRPSDYLWQFFVNIEMSLCKAFVIAEKKHESTLKKYLKIPSTGANLGQQ